MLSFSFNVFIYFSCEHLLGHIKSGESALYCKLIVLFPQCLGAKKIENVPLLTILMDCTVHLHRVKVLAHLSTRSAAAQGVLDDYFHQ